MVVVFLGGGFFLFFLFPSSLFVICGRLCSYYMYLSIQFGMSFYDAINTLENTARLGLQCLNEAMS